MTSRRNDPETSKAAADAIAEHAERLQGMILRQLNRYHQGLTTRWLAANLGIDFASISPRMAPMERKGWVEMTEKKVKSPHSKGWGHVWVITPAGRGQIL